MILVSDPCKVASGTLRRDAVSRNVSSSSMSNILRSWSRLGLIDDARYFVQTCLAGSGNPAVTRTVTREATVDVLSPGVDRWPDAQMRQVKGTWWVDAGKTHVPGLPRGVRRDDDYNWEPGREPIQLKETLHEVVEHLRDTALYEGQEAAAHLTEHVAMFGLPDLCGAHGKPIWHDGRPTGRSCPYAGIPDGDNVGAPLPNVVRLINFLDALRDASEHLTQARTKLSPRVVDDVLAFEILPQTYSDTIRSELARDAGLGQIRSRQLVRLAFDAAMSSSGLIVTSRWEPQRRPELALVARSTVALYLADTLAHVGTTSADRTFLCAVCGQPTTPKRSPRPGEGIYCRRTECQRKRATLKQARYRAGKGK